MIEQVQQLALAWLAGMGLTLKPSKTCITHTLIPYENHLGFDFLGFHIQQYLVEKLIQEKDVTDEDLASRRLSPQVGQP